MISLQTQLLSFCSWEKQKQKMATVKEMSLDDPKLQYILFVHPLF